MVSTSSAVLVAVAVLSWPPGRVAGRLRHVLAVGPPLPGPRRLRRPTTCGVAVVAGVAGAVLSGPAGAVAAALAGATAWRRWTARRGLLRRLAAVDGLAEALGSMVAELRAGAHPAVAAESAAADAEPQAARALRAIAAAARLGGTGARVVPVGRAGSPVTGAALDQLVRAWILVQRHGLPLADVLDAVRGDLDTRARFARQVLARMAGPRASATILALLPAVGVALGEVMGARPLGVLTGTATGHLLLVLGVGLDCAGVAWSARLTEQVVLR